MSSEWQLQEAKGNLSQLIKRVAGGDAQLVTVHGKPTAVVISADEYAQLTQRRGKRSATLLCSDPATEELDFARNRDIGRDVAAPYVYRRTPKPSNTGQSVRHPGPPSPHWPPPAPGPKCRTPAPRGAQTAVFVPLTALLRPFLD